MTQLKLLISGYFIEWALRLMPAGYAGRYEIAMGWKLMSTQAVKDIK